jgi:hypothetical protein
MWAIFNLTPKWDQNYSFIQHNHYILITNTLISSLIPATWVHPNEKFKIQQNKTVKMTYVPNTIRISAHVVDFSHQGLRFWGRTQNCQWSHSKVSRGDRRKREREKEQRERDESHILPTSRTMVVGMTPSWVTPSNMTWLDQRLI